MYRTFHSAFRKLPPNWRLGVKKLLGAEGHGTSTFDWLTARKDGAGKKRLDNALESLVETLGPASARLVRDKICVDFGAGYVPTDGIAMWLLGAQQVYALDYNDIARVREMARAVRGADRSRIANQLRVSRAAPQWADRLDEVLDWATGKVGNAFPPGCSYAAPVDVINSPSLLPQFDILVSTSVLEHIPPSLIVALLRAIQSRGMEGAVQIHKVDLRDHRDFENEPYGFLDPSQNFDSEFEADSRGNGMTLQDWEHLVGNHPELDIAVSEYENGRPYLLPDGVTANGPIADSLILRTRTDPGRFA